MPGERRRSVVPPRRDVRAFAAAPWQEVEWHGSELFGMCWNGTVSRIGCGACSAEEARSMADAPRAVGGSLHAPWRDRAAGAARPRPSAGWRSSAVFGSSKERRVTGIDRGRDRWSFATDRPRAVKRRARDRDDRRVGAGMARTCGAGLANVADFMVATEPIPERIEELGWRDHVAILDMRELLLYLRRTDDGRIAIGGGATGVLFGGHVGRASTHDRRIAEVAAESLLWLFPQLEGVCFTHAWGGPIDMSPSFMPFYRTLPPGRRPSGARFLRPRPGGHEGGREDPRLAGARPSGRMDLDAGGRRRAREVPTGAAAVPARETVGMGDGKRRSP